MPLRVTYGDTDVRVAIAFKQKTDVMMTRLTEKMTYLMTRLQEKARGNINSRSGKLAEGIENPRAHTQGNQVIGELDWGRGDSAPYAKTVEDGFNKMIAINPKAAIGAYRGGFAFGAYRPAHGATKAKSALMFYSSRLGKKVFADFVFRPPIVGQHFMARAVTEMKAEYVAELKATINGLREP